MPVRFEVLGDERRSFEGNFHNLPNFEVHLHTNIRPFFSSKIALDQQRL